ncbi:unnamed protein product [Albugo candida]|uniref:Uncharacterized protein n=1 Tax=Albugo candida TaxID=65357 RepID=A0A024GCF6_9STRA|nr:unnamed protein product [Albugo candida]|eukprot:CCI44361.1 unnamed protein product [Albugo candida]
MASIVNAERASNKVSRRTSVLYIVNVKPVSGIDLGCFDSFGEDLSGFSSRSASDTWSDGAIRSVVLVESSSFLTTTAMIVIIMAAAIVIPITSNSFLVYISIVVSLVE